MFLFGVTVFTAVVCVIVTAVITATMIESKRRLRVIVGVFFFKGFLLVVIT